VDGWQWQVGKHHAYRCHCNSVQHAASHASGKHGHALTRRLVGLTKMVSKLSKEGAWRKALEVFEAVDDMG
jgi:hypothetical protein